MIDYELAKKLEEAGFPEPNDLEPHAKVCSPERNKDGLYDYVYVPELSELIEECGKDGRTFKSLQNIDGKWRATGYHNEKDIYQDCGGFETPQIALSELYIALNKGSNLKPLGSDSNVNPYKKNDR